jgi:hypothetical protein
MLGNVLPEISGRGEGLLASPVNAFEHSCCSLVFHLVKLESSPSSFHTFSAELTLLANVLDIFGGFHVYSSRGTRIETLSVLGEPLGLQFAPWAAAQVLLKLSHGGKLFAATLAIESRVWSDVKTERAGAEY